jgi:conjugative transfer signal peptidase TraF
MPEHRELPLFRWGEELRRHRHAKRKSRRCIIAAAAAAATVTPAIGTLVWPPRPALLWNASASSPIGLYRIGEADSLRVGDLVVAWPPEDARELGAERHYLPRNVPLVKSVAAVAGDRVCAVGEAVFVDGRLETLRSDRDPSGRRMPWWTGCEDLSGGDLFLFSPDAPQAFDGRYFGITRASQIVGRARLIWRG